MSPTTGAGWISLKEAAEILGMSHHTVRAVLLKAGVRRKELPVARTQWDRGDVERLLAQSVTSDPGPPKWAEAASDGKSVREGVSLAASPPARRTRQPA